MTANRSTDEDAFEALLAGRPCSAQAAPLEALTRAVCAASAQPGRASAQLAELIATGHLPETGVPSPPAVVAPSGPAPARASGPPKRSRRMLIPSTVAAALAKVAAAGTLAQATAGLTLVAAGVTGAGAVGVLPGPAQDSFARVVAQVTPLEAPTSQDAPADGEGTGSAATDPTSVPTAGASTDPTTGPTTAPTADPTTTPTSDPATGDDDGTTGAPTSTATARNFGAVVSADARDGGVEGQEVSAAARARNEGRRSARTASPTPSATATSSPSTDDETEDDDDSTATADEDGRSGHGGSSSGSGSGRSGSDDGDS